MPRPLRIDLSAAMRKLPPREPVLALTFDELLVAYTAAKPGDDALTRLKKWRAPFGAFNAWAVEQAELERAAEAMLAGGYSPATVNRDLSAIGSAYKWAREVRKIAPAGFRSPTRDIRRYAEAMKVVYVSGEEAKRLRALALSFKDRRFAVWVWLLMDTGARPAELYPRTWGELDCERREIVLKHETTKTGAARILHFGEDTAALIQRVRPAAKKLHEGLAFEGRKKGSPIAWRRAWKDLVAMLGRPELTPYDLRHAAAARLLQAGAPVAVAAQVMGHSSLILQRRYGHLESKHLKAAQEVAWTVQREAANSPGEGQGTAPTSALPAQGSDQACGRRPDTPAALAA